MDEHNKPIRTSVKLTAYALFALILLLIVGLGLEFFFRGNPAYGRTGFKFDKHLIYRLNPGLSAQKAHASGQTGLPPFPLTFNKQGFRGPNFVNQKQDDVERILVIGDSYTAGLDYPDENIFTAQWETFLNRNGSYEVLNASCPAWGTDQQYIYWKREGMALQPNKVVIMFSPNDMREMWNHGLIRADAKDQELIVKEANLPFSNRVGWKLATKSSLYQFLQKNVFNSDHGNFLKIFHDYPVNYGVMDSTDWDMPLFLKEPFQAVDDSYELLEKLLQNIKTDCEKIGADFHLVKIPIRLEIDSTYQDSIFSRTIVETRLADIAQRNGITFHNFNERLRRDSVGESIFMSWEYHYNQEGHDWIARGLHEEVPVQN